MKKTLTHTEDANTTNNQAIKREFINREVIQNASQFIYEIQSRLEGINCIDYTEAYMAITSTPDYIGTVEREDNYHVQYSKTLGGYVWVDSYSHTVSLPFGSEREAYQECVEENVELNNNLDYIEALEHWIVSNWLAGKLSEKGEMITRDFFGFMIWGRTCSGQAILLDTVISEICSDMGILKGQENEWRIN